VRLSDPPPGASDQNPAFSSDESRLVDVIVCPFPMLSPRAGIPVGSHPGVRRACGFVIRTVFEDETLLQELSGYREYASRVRYRLIPGIW